MLEHQMLIGDPKQILWRTTAVRPQEKNRPNEVGKPASYCRRPSAVIIQTCARPHTIASQPLASEFRGLLSEYLTVLQKVGGVTPG